MSSKLFQPTKVGKMTLQNRVVLASMSRMRASTAHVPIVKDYYVQRAHAPGTFLVSEATFIAAKAGGMDHAPGIWSDEQIEVWKQARIGASPPLFPSLKFRQITEAVHKKGCFIYCQLWALGRAGIPEVLDREGFPYVSASDVPLTGRSRAPRPLTVDEIKECSGGFQGMSFASIQGSKPTFAYLVSQIKSQHPDLSYLHIIEPRIFGNFDRETVDPDEENDFIREIWAPKTLIATGGYNRQTAMEAADKTNDLIAFGRHFVSNIAETYPSTRTKELFYLADYHPEGYTNYPFAEK
ncbi:NADH:flavin oxidoreductase/NADH oxidase [Desarmillaria ectypa]|nr:NADH:flavin oxidoreductase/NADH oxidase [Desarmillaria ectypa]